MSNRGSVGSMGRGRHGAFTAAVQRLPQRSKATLAHRTVHRLVGRTTPVIVILPVRVTTRSESIGGRCPFSDQRSGSICNGCRIIGGSADRSAITFANAVFQRSEVDRCILPDGRRPLARRSPSGVRRHLAGGLRQWTGNRPAIARMALGRPAISGRVKQHPTRPRPQRRRTRSPWIEP